MWNIRPWDRCGGPERVSHCPWIQNSVYDENKIHLLLPCFDIGNKGIKKKATVKLQYINTNQDSAWNGAVYHVLSIITNILEVKTKKKQVFLKKWGKRKHY